MRGIESDGFQHHLSGKIQILQVEPFLDRMDVAHAGREIGDFQPLLVKDVGVTSAPGCHCLDFDIQVLGRSAHQLDNRRLIGDVHAVVITFDFSFHPRSKRLAIQFQFVTSGGLFQAPEHMLGLPVQFFLVVTSRFAF